VDALRCFWRASGPRPGDPRGGGVPVALWPKPGWPDAGPPAGPAQAS
jgi:hypothetical protein